MYQIEAVEEIIEESSEKEEQSISDLDEKSLENQSELNKQGKYSCAKCEMTFDLKVDLKVRQLFFNCIKKI